MDVENKLIAVEAVIHFIQHRLPHSEELQGITRDANDFLSGVNQRSTVSGYVSLQPRYRE